MEDLEIGGIPAEMEEMLENQVGYEKYGNYLFYFENTVIPTLICKPYVGNGGDAGRINVRYRTINGKFDLKTCGGVGALPAINGAGGKGNVVLAYQNGYIISLLLSYFVTRSPA